MNSASVGGGVDSTVVAGTVVHVSCGRKEIEELRKPSQILLHLSKEVHMFLLDLMIIKVTVNSAGIQFTN